MGNDRNEGCARDLILVMREGLNNTMTNENWEMGKPLTTKKTNKIDEKGIKHY